jgi:ATP-dependent DNA ligase
MFKQSRCAQQTIVSLHGARTANAHLGAIFRDAVKNCEEGLFVKPLQSQYNGFRPKDRWTKLKRGALLLLRPP